MSMMDQNKKTVSDNRDGTGQVLNDDDLDMAAGGVGSGDTESPNINAIDTINPAWGGNTMGGRSYDDFQKVLREGLKK